MFSEAQSNTRLYTRHVVQRTGDVWHFHASFHGNEERAEHGDESQHVELMSSGRLVSETLSQRGAVNSQSRLETFKRV